MHTANCGPLSPPPNGHISPYTSTLEGAEVMLLCQNGLQSSLKENQTTVVCNHEGNWEPAPADICSEASGIIHYSPTFQSLTLYGNMTNSGSSPTGLNRDAVIAVVSSVTVFIVSSLLFLAIGFVWGYCCGRKRRQLPKEILNKTTYPQSTLLCEDTQANTPDKDLELKENVAYGTVRSTLRAQQGITTS